MSCLVVVLVSVVVVILVILLDWFAVMGEQRGE